MKILKMKPVVLCMLAITSSPAAILHAKNSTASTSLNFNAKNYTLETVKVDGTEIRVRAYKNIVYVQHPVDKTYQSMNIYIPEAYFNGKRINGYDARTAPVFLPNNVGGYMPAEPGSLSNQFPPMMPGAGHHQPPAGTADIPPGGQGARGGNAGKQRPNTIASALAHGYVVASPGARGRSNKDEKGQYTGKAPAAIVDLKAAVRYLKFNDRVMPGDASKIISNGTSAGAALSTLLGATGDAKDYEPYLKQLGAAHASDKIFAVSAYAAITNLEHADAAYEWQLSNVHNYKKIDMGMLDYKVERKEQAGTLTDAEIRVSNDLKSMFPAYLNSLKLKDPHQQLLQLDQNGNGTFKNYIKSLIMQSAQKALQQGTDLSGFRWLVIQQNKVTDMDYDAYLQSLGRQKLPPAFDALDLSSGENDEFGTATIAAQHFTAYSLQHSTRTSGKTADPQVVKMMNPIHYIATPGASTARYWRIRQGTMDKDTSFAIPAILATTLENKGYSVDFSLAWAQPHGGDYDLDELFGWIDRIARK